MTINRLTRYVASGFFAMLLPLLAQAQEPVRSFEQLDVQMMLAEGDEVRLVDVDGVTVNGRFESVSADSMDVVVDGSRRSILEESVREIRLQRPDSRENGVLIGLAAGVGAGYVGVVSACDLPDPECGANVGAILFPVFAGVGVLAGFLIDHLIHGYDTVFEAPNPAQSSRIAIFPVVEKQEKGIQVSISF